MEKIILITILITLFLVSIAYNFFVIFKTLKKKVDIKINEQSISDINSKIDIVLNRIIKLEKEKMINFEDKLNYVETDYSDKINELRMVINSRCDKLYSEIENVKK